MSGRESRDEAQGGSVQALQCGDRLFGFAICPLALRVLITNAERDGRACAFCNLGHISGA